MSPIRKPTLSDFLLVVLLGTLWGSAFAAIKVGVEEVGPVILVFVRVAIACALIWAWLLWRGVRIPSTRRQWAMLTVMGMLNTVIPFWLIAWAEQFIASGVAALIMSSGPLLALVLAHFTTGDDRFTVYKFAGVLLGISGVATVIGTEALQGGNGDLTPALAIFLANVCFVISGAMIRHVPDTSAEAMAGANMGVALVAMLPFLAFIEMPSVSEISLPGIAALLYLGIFVSGFSYVLRFHIATTVGVSYMTLAAYIMPVAGVILGALLLGEAIVPATVIALVLTVAGLLVARMGR